MGNTAEIPRAIEIVVDIRDVALAHIVARPTEEEIAAAVRAARPNAPVTTTLAHQKDIVPLKCSCIKAKTELGLRFHSLDEMVRSMCDT
ncbi:hypothetical protein AC1031_002055 [Aphanomyces cochlioides]|nr:hypothetical protein AC1031_002055 [Aphanomyces cochlioides]